MPVLDLQSRFRCRECDARGKVVISIKVGGIAIGRCNFWANSTSPNSRLRQVVAPDTVGYLQEARAIAEKTAGLQFITVCYRILNTRSLYEMVRAMTFKDLTPSAY